jgi:AraC family transcriptional regulator
MHRPAIERALRFIGERLEQPISVVDVAHAAHLSEFHLHRVFHTEVGESIGRFIMRRRLELAALRLAYEPDHSITEIALGSGYSSGSNFGKAFAGYFGCSPSRVRSPELGMPASIGKLMSQYGKDFHPQVLYTLPPERHEDERKREAAHWNACVRYEDSPGLDFACLASPSGYDYETLHSTWADMIERARQLGLAEHGVDAWGMALDSPQLTAPELCRYHACVPYPEHVALPAPLFRGRMQPGRYAVFRYAGSVDGVADAYRSIYSCWFAESSLAPADFVPIDHYITGFPSEGHAEYEMWMRVRTRRDVPATESRKHAPARS